MWHRNSGAMRSKCTNSMLKVRYYKHSESRAVWILKSESGSLGLYLQHIFKNQPWLLRESGETAQNLHVCRSIVPFVNSTHNLYLYKDYTNSTNLRAVVGLPW